MHAIVCALLMLLALAVPAAAQDVSGRPVEISGTVGWGSFVDESLLHHLIVGPTARFYLTRRLSFQPEVAYLRGPDLDRDVTVLLNAAFDFATTKRVKPYVVGGVGWLWHRDGFRPSPTQTTSFWSHSGTFGGGVGVKVFVTEKLFVSPEFRIGWEPVMRSTVSVGYRF